MGSLLLRSETVIASLDLVLDRSTSHVALGSSSNNDGLSVHVLAPGLARVRAGDRDCKFQRTWAVCDARGLPPPREGRDRSVSALATPLGPLPVAEAVDKGAALSLDVGLGLSVRLLADEARLEWSLGDRLVISDLPHRAYVRGSPHGVAHFLRRKPGKQHFYGFGEPSGPLDKAGRRITQFPVDAMGYNAESSDPLYKHWPFYITLDTEHDFAYGIFYDTTAACVFDQGQEIDAFFGFYSTFQAVDGDLDYYVIAGPTVADVARKFVLLTGKPELMPRWSLGYLGSTMTYTESPAAQERLREFVDLCERHDIECSMFHLSSGYTLDNGQRYVFTWSKSVPDPRAMVAHFAAANVHLAANVKPWLLESHPKFAEAAARGALLPHRAPFWAGGAFTVGFGRFVDFSSAAGFDWWVEQLAASVLEYGIEVPWNDNNEFRLPEGDAMLDGFGTPIRPSLGRPLQTLLMAMASREACRRVRPTMRPYVLTRSASVGCQRFCQSWSGDNTTSFHTLAFNNAMSSSMSLSGLHNTGHDVGGFYGPMPTRELLLRWMASQIFMPRFTLHSFKEGGAVTTPWSYADAVDDARFLVRFRRRLRPTLYAAAWRSSHSGVPIVRPLVYDFQSDPLCRTESTLYMLGDSILAVTVVAEGAQSVAVRLPSTARWCDFHSGQWHDGGTTAVVDAPLGRALLFVRAGGAVALADGRADDAPVRVLFAVPPRAAGWPGELQQPVTLVFDDGVSVGYQRGEFAELEIHAQRGADARDVVVRAVVKHDGFARPAAVPVALLGSDGDRLVDSGGQPLARAADDADDSNHVSARPWFVCQVD